jgi:Cu+-exporting ATPase
VQAQNGKAAVQRLADRMAAVFVPVVIALALATLAGWLIAGGGAAHAFTAAVAVLIIACPCALGLATPTALLVGTGRGAQLGLLIKGPEVLESTRRVDTVVLDKTGTVTTGQMTLLSIHPAATSPGVPPPADAPSSSAPSLVAASPSPDAFSAADAFSPPASPSSPAASRSPDALSSSAVLRLAGAVEHLAEHPIARAIASAARASTRASIVRASTPGAPARASDAASVARAADPASVASTLTSALTLPPAEGFESMPGLGVSATVEGHVVVVGRPSYLEQKWALPLPADLARVVTDAAGLGQTAVAVGWDGAVRGVLIVADAVKPGAREAIDGLRALGLEPMLLTGDHEAAAKAVAAQVGIPESSVIAGVLPEGKAAAVRALQASGRVVAMAGDGVNDAAALATADLGLSMGTGTDAAIEAADLTLVRTSPDGTGVDLTAAVDAIRLARRTLATIKGNLFWAFAYNLAAIPLAAAGLLNPLIAGAAMAASSLFVVSNSLRLRGFRSIRP